MMHFSLLAHSTVMMNRKWLFVNGGKFKSPIYTMAKFLHSFKDGKIASMSLETVVENNTSVEQMVYT
jgi:hypothetical protein